MTTRAFRIGALAGALFAAGSAFAQLRVATWNVTNYGGAGSRDASFQTAIYSDVPAGLALAGHAMAPDVLVGQEFLSQAGVAAFLALLNTAPGSPGDWAAAPFLDGPDTDSAFFYRTSRVQYVSTWTIALGSSSTCNQPRHTRRYDFRPIGYSSAATGIGVYSIHLKAQGSNAACPSGENAEGRRLIECQRIRDNAAGVDTNPNWTPATGGTNPTGSSALPAGFTFMVAGDANIQNASRPDYQALVAPGNSGRVYDPIAAPGGWNNNETYRSIHTQEQTTQLDDRYDLILVSGSLLDATGLDYIGVLLSPQNPAAWNLGTWNDPNHSYRCWGNDGSTYNAPLRVNGNAMVGPIIAQALMTSAAGNGHLPVYADFRVPAKATATASIDFGTVDQGSLQQRTFSVGNAGDASRWSVAGIDTLRYSMIATPGLSVPAGTFTDAAGGSLNSHTLTLDTGPLGHVAGFITIDSNDPDQPSVQISVSGDVAAPPPDCPPCPADFNNSGGTPDDADVSLFFAAWAQGDPCADANASGGTPDDADVSAFFAAWNAGGC